LGTDEKKYSPIQNKIIKMASHAEHHDWNLDEKYTLTSRIKNRIFGAIGLGAILCILGIVMLAAGVGEHHHDAAHGEHADAAHHAFHWTTRLWAVLWQNTVFFTGISVIGLFFVAIQYVAWAGWSTVILRVPLAFGAFLPVGGVLLVALFLVGGHDLFHWTHHYLYDINDPHYDPIIAGKAGYLNTPFFLARMVVFVGLWFLMYTLIRKRASLEDAQGGILHHDKSIVLSAIFLVIFAVSSSMAAWDWVMSIDTHWFSTLFGWYTFASWWVTGLATITLAVVFLKEQGYLGFVNQSHLHDLGKFMFAFSVFWAYLFFAQFLLIYYANMPEESIYFIDRLQHFDGKYAGTLFTVLFINFVFPFLFFMTRDAKRHASFLKIGAIAIIIGHWLDFYLMIMPGTVKEHGGMGFLEIGTAILFAGVFVLMMANALAKMPLVPKNHPMLQESLHHDI
jgi:hypothetical protein